MTTARASYETSRIKRHRSTKTEVEDRRCQLVELVRWDLPSRPTKTTDSRAKNFGDISVELDAIAPDDLRALVEAVIQRHLPRKQLDILLAAEESERAMLTAFAEQAVEAGL
jgi:hypothetical protein